MPKQKSMHSLEEQRHYNMSRIKSKDTSIEVLFRKSLWHEGIRYRKNFKSLPGRPDIAITKYKIAIFCDGEFWHGRHWEIKKSKIKNNREYWIKKIERNMQRDNETDLQLRAQGWLVMRFWGDDIKKDISLCVDEVKEAIFYTNMGIYDGFLSYDETYLWDGTEELIP
jgi:DNA mismatch endonuclease (patch repair protein)